MATMVLNGDAPADQHVYYLALRLNVDPLQPERRAGLVYQMGSGVRYDMAEVWGALLDAIARSDETRSRRGERLDLRTQVHGRGS